MSGYVNVKRNRITGQWQVVSPWGATNQNTWDEAMSEADRLRGTVRQALTRRAEYISTSDGTCAYFGCHEPGHHLSPGRGFCFCPEHAAIAQHVLDNPKARHKHWPKMKGIV
ncbi:hypothetical protein [Corynebacterium sp.]|uniref:hypothetical protein n=1 Tax=Corynebacterium sp. TaxID=1720 RepID=UPI0025C61B3F|nr:hypothetical protein [Corynebacterium sp.]